MATPHEDVDVLVGLDVGKSEPVNTHFGAATTATPLTRIDRLMMIGSVLLCAEAVDAVWREQVADLRRAPVAPEATTGAVRPPAPTPEPGRRRVGRASSLRPVGLSTGSGCRGDTHGAGR